MDSKHVAETWLFYGISDLYFSFHTEEWVFDYHSAFSGIMALEKHLKAFLLFHRASEFLSLNDKKAKNKIQSIAREYGHDFPKMIASCDTFLASGRLKKMVDNNFDGYNGKELIVVLKDSYMETRYPTSIQVSQKFPVGGTGFYHNPLSSSGLHHFIV